MKPSSPIVTSQVALDMMVEARNEVFQSEQPVIMVTVVRAVGSNPQQVGARLLLFSNDEIRGTVGGGRIESHVLRDAKLMLEEDEPHKLLSYNLQEIGMTCGGVMDFFLERIDPAPHLILFGGGHVSQPTAALAAEVGFRVTVIDDRLEWGNPERFPQATVLNQPFPTFLETFTPQPNHYLVMVSQGHAHDKVILEHVIAGPQRYTGVIGSKQKAHKLWKELRAAGIQEELWQQVHCPMGLPIGGRTPSEIAVSIVGQLIEVRRGSNDW
ncbi:MAG: xanthine dehydrogenase accessory protein XdhC [Deltaproteobacteria bacterium]|nr:MAG: xanthine dehydrogenase accessory protein XdhC [Deltaproteobacteria bacterium]